MQDTIVTIGKQMGSIQSAMQTLQNTQLEMHKAYLNANSRSGIQSQGPPLAVQAFSGGSMHCFYCWGPGHRIAECEHVQADAQKGWTVLIEGRPRMPNKAPLPKDPSNISPHDRLVKLYDKQVGLFFGWPTDESPSAPTYSTYVNAARDTRCVQGRLWSA